MHHLFDKTGLNCQYSQAFSEPFQTFQFVRVLLSPHDLMRLCLTSCQLCAFNIRLGLAQAIFVFIIPVRIDHQH